MNKHNATCKEFEIKLKQAEKRIQRAEEKLRYLFSSSAAVIYTIL